MFIYLNPQKSCFLVATTISFGMAGVHEQAFVWWPLPPFFPILTQKYFYYHGRINPPHPNGMRLVSDLILWSLYNWLCHSTLLYEIDSWQSYFWQKNSNRICGKAFFMYLNFNGDPKYLPIIICILKVMPVPHSHILPWLLSLDILLLLHLCASWLLARTVLHIIKQSIY